MLESKSNKHSTLTAIELGPLVLESCKDLKILSPTDSEYKFQKWESKILLIGSLPDWEPAVELIMVGSLKIQIAREIQWNNYQILILKNLKEHLWVIRKIFC